MELNRAVTLLKEFIERCPNLDGNNFPIMVPKSPLLLGTEGYEIIIRSRKRLDMETSAILHDIVSREKLAITQRPRTTMIYNPMHYTLLK